LRQITAAAQHCTTGYWLASGMLQLPVSRRPATLTLRAAFAVESSTAAVVMTKTINYGPEQFIYFSEILRGF